MDIYEQYDLRLEQDKLASLPGLFLGLDRWIQGSRTGLDSVGGERLS